jgi:hypothetical protein
MAVMALHEIMNNLSEEDMAVVTYGKVLFRKTPAYGIFKMLVYNMYFADVPGHYMLKV